MHRLKILCDEAKQTLSQSEMAFVRLDGLPDILVYGCEVSSVQFELCIKSTLQQNIDLIKDTLNGIKLSKLIINGSSTKIPLFRKMLADQLKQYKFIPCNQEWLREGLMAVKSGSVHVLDITPFEIRIEGDEKYSCLAVSKG